MLVGGDVEDETVYMIRREIFIHFLSFFSTPKVEKFFFLTFSRRTKSLKNVRRWLSNVSEEGNIDMEPRMLTTFLMINFD